MTLRELMPIKEASNEAQVKWKEVRIYLHEAGDTAKVESLEEIVQEFVPWEDLVLIRDDYAGCLLHIACSYGADVHVLQHLLKFDENKVTLLCRNFALATPLHNICDAINDEPPLEGIKALLEADEKNEAVLTKTDQDDLPLHYACWRRQPIEIIKLLLDADKANVTTETENCHGRIPLETACHRNAPESTLRYLIEYNSNCDYKWKALRVVQCKRLGNIIASSRELQEMVNEKVCSRCFVFMVLSDFYAHLGLICAFIFWTETVVGARTSSVENYLLYFFISYFIMREALKISSLKGAYFRDGWNFVSMTKIATLILSCITFEGEYETGSINKRSLLMITAVFVFIGMISFLRFTFMQFAMFVNGILKVFRKLFPFGVVSILVLATFSHLYFLDGFSKEDCILEETDISQRLDSMTFCSVGDIFPGVFTFLVRGLDGVATTIDYIFALTVAIVFLNILIAIIVNEWNSHSSKVISTFYNYRIAFLAEIRIFHYFEKVSIPCLHILENYGWIERRKNGVLYFREDYQWTDGSWIQRILFSVGFLPTYYLLFLFGFLSFGILWPSEIRFRLFRHENTSKEKAKELLGVDLLHTLGEDLELFVEVRDFLNSNEFTEKVAGAQFLTKVDHRISKLRNLKRY
ncbi:hypothetical protein CTEN210_10244 [Chaetoceros tenuissimus]|uniref:Ion transport domain-containing protein n=1 Tax=Chaetoceros tenuissimus TaxID=426638 RepID=A0AAD3CX23_9STRA|nr:hypothetical protein CTEN210_10244 [Chaetoceros tenuissimus]